MGKKFARAFCVLFFGVAGYAIGSLYSRSQLDLSPEELKPYNLGGIILVGAMTGYLIGPWFYNLLQEFNNWLEGHIRALSAPAITSGVLGMMLGLLVANLLLLPVSIALGGAAYRGSLLPLVVMWNLLLAYVGMAAGVKIQWGGRRPAAGSPAGRPKILDSSVLIDGRIVDIALTGFVEGDLVIPEFIMQELRYIADSQDPLRRSRGRRGMDIMSALQQNFGEKVKLLDAPWDKEVPVDDQLIRLAKEIGGLIVTNDYNLNKHATVSGVDVLNINDLANAVKSVVLPGEELQIQILKEGKEHDQGVGYLADGTMVVVENGRRFMNEMVHVTVTNMLQTASGRVIFAKPKQLSYR